MRESPALVESRRFGTRTVPALRPLGCRIDTLGNPGYPPLALPVIAALGNPSRVFPREDVAPTRSVSETVTSHDNLVALVKQAGLVGELIKNVKVVKSGELTRKVVLKGIGATAGVVDGQRRREAEAAGDGGLRDSGSCPAPAGGAGSPASGHQAAHGPSAARADNGARRRAAQREGASTRPRMRGTDGRHVLRPRKSGRSGCSNAAAQRLRSGSSAAGSRVRATV